MTYDSKTRASLPSRSTVAATALALAALAFQSAAFAQTKAVDADEPAATTTKSPAAPKPLPTVDPPKGHGDPLLEKHDHWYLWVGAGYQGTVLPAFLLGAFVTGAPTTYLSTFKLSADFRKNGFSVVPSLSFSEYGTGDVLFLQRGKNEAVNGNWSVVNSNIKSINAQVDLLWSTKVHRMVDIEYGLGVGVGATFGGLLLNWVYGDDQGKYVSDSGRRFSACTSNVNPPNTNGCNARDHSNSDVDRVDNYKERSWFNGGSKPSFLPILTPEIGVRIKPHQNFMTRVGLGWGLYGPWFGLSGYYGFDKPIGRSGPPRAPRGSEEEVVETSE